MKKVLLALAVAVGLSGLYSEPSYAQSTTAEAKRASTRCPKGKPVMVLAIRQDEGLAVEAGLGFAMESLKRGIPTNIWLLGTGVRLADETAQQTDLHRRLREFMSMGGKVYVCPMCAQRFGVKEIVKGAELGTPDNIFKLLSQPNVRLTYWP